MTRITATTGTSNIRGGVTTLNIGSVKPDGTLIVRELQRSFMSYLDGVTQRLPASTQGANSGVLGEWVNRTIDVPDGSILFLSYDIKSSSMPIKKSLTFAFKAAETHPLVEMLFHVVTDRHSTLHELPVSGRLKMMSVDEITEDLKKSIRVDMSLIHTRAIETLEKLSEDAVLEYWSKLASSANTEGSTFLTVNGNASFEEYPIKVKYLLPAKRGDERVTKGKAVKTSAGRNVIITGRKRRIKLA
jgi:hypothetical protein